MTSSQRRQIRQSLQRILDDPRLNRPVTNWSLVVPMDPTSEDEGWFHQLTAQAPFPCDWKGQLFWDSEAGKHAHVIDYYLRDGKARLEGRVRDLQHLLDQPGTPLRVADISGRWKAFVPRSTATIPITAMSSRPRSPLLPYGRSRAW